MTAPAVQQVPPGTRLPNGYVVMPGGYQPNPAGGPQQQVQQDVTQLGQPAAQNVTMPQLPQQQGWTPPYVPPQAQPQVQPQFQQQGQWPPQTGAVPQFAPQVQQQTWQPPGQQPPVPIFLTQQAVPQQQPGAWPSLDDRIPQGPGVPPELAGRSVRELIAISNGLRQVHLQSLTTPQQQGNIQTPPPLQQQGAPAQGQQPGQQQQFDWRNPQQGMRDAARDAIREVFQQEIGPAMQPVIQNNMLQQARSAKDQVMAEIGVQRFQQLEPMIVQNLNGIDPRALLNPQTWRIAAQVAAGAMALAPQQQQQPQYQPQQQPGGYPVQQMNQIQNPLPNLNTFFSEQPNQGGRGPQGIQLTQEQIGAAQAMNMPIADYAAWLGGGR